MCRGIEAASCSTCARSGSNFLRRQLFEARADLQFERVPALQPLPSSSQAQSVSSKDFVIEQVDAAAGAEQVELVAPGAPARGAARDAAQNSPGRARTGAIVGQREVAQRVGVFGHERGCIRPLSTRAVRVERKQLDQRREAELREVQIGARQRLELDGRGAERHAVALPEFCATAGRRRSCSTRFVAQRGRDDCRSCASAASSSMNALQ